MSGLQAQAVLRRKLIAAERVARRTRRIARPDLPAAWLMTDPQRTPDPVVLARRLPRGWGIIFRHFGAEDRAGIARGLARICRRRGLVLLISADPDLAREVRAHGVHWPEQRLPLRALRSRPGQITTAAAHGPRALRRAARAGCDAALLSPVFGSRSPSAGKPMGAARYRTLARRSPLPVLALAGVTAHTAARTLSKATPNAAGWAATEGVSQAWMSGKR